MKKWIVGIIVIVLFVFDWAALDDITTGSEPNYVGEYAVLLVSVIIYMFIGIRWIKRGGDRYE